MPNKNPGWSDYVIKIARTAFDQGAQARERFDKFLGFGRKTKK
jgi:hypothetical protein